MAFNPKSPEGHTPWDYAQTIVTQLHQLTLAVEAGRGDSPQIRRLIFTGTLDAAAQFTKEFELPLGKNWSLTGVSYETGAATGDLRIYVNEISGANLVKILLSTASGAASDTFDNGCDVTPEDQKLVIRFQGVNPGEVILGNIRLNQYDANPNSAKEATG